MGSAMLSIFLYLLIFCVVHGEGVVIRYAEEKEVPYQVSIRNFRTNGYLCSGVLITRRSVLSLASCLTETESIVKVSAGSIYLSRQNTAVMSVSIRMHEDYLYNISGNNIAVIKLSDPLPINDYIQPAIIPRQGEPLVNGTEMSGWMLEDVRDSLIIVENITLWKKECQKMFKLENDIKQDEFCGEYKINSEMTLAGRGTLTSKKGVVYGILNEVNHKKNMQRYTHISEHSDWIKEVLGEESLQIKWFDKTNESATGGTPSKCMAASLLFAILMCR